MHSLTERVLSDIRRQELLRAGDRVGVAVSGGIDSVALLRLLLDLRGELGIVLSVVHFNHRLRGAESDADQEFVAGLAREHDLEFFCDGDDVTGHAREEGVSLETAARKLRYGFFRHLIRPEPQQEVRTPTLSQTARQGWGTPVSLDKIVTGHTLDDQAETVLMRMIRGSGLRGLGGIHPRMAVENDDGEPCGEIVRPLLGVRRRELEKHLGKIGQTWREDSTNADDRITRNRVRKLVVPLLEREFNPAVAENLAELAEIARGEEDYWENEVAGWMGTAVQWSAPEWAREASPGLSGSPQELVQIAGLDNPQTMASPVVGLRSRIDGARWLVMNASVSRVWFLGEPIAVQRRVVKAIGEQAGIPLEFKHVEEIVHFAAENGTGKELSMPLGWKVVLEPEELIFLTPDLQEQFETQDYDYEIPVPGQVTVCETSSVIEVRLIPADVGEGYNSQHLLDANALPGPLRVRNWRAGDRYWPAHSKSPKKIKELLQERQVPHSERRLWPVVVSGNEVVWVRGFPPPAKLLVKSGRVAILIEERTLAGEPAT